MGDKGKGKDSQKEKAKKAKVSKGGNRPHEQRARDATAKAPEGAAPARS